MTSVFGHVMTLDFIGKYNNWDKVDPVSNKFLVLPLYFIILFYCISNILLVMFKAELFSCPTEKKEAVPRLKIPFLLAKEGAHCDYLILWLDCDKEGENICFEVIHAVQQGMNRRLNPNVSLLNFNLIIHINLMKLYKCYICYRIFGEQDFLLLQKRT